MIKNVVFDLGNVVTKFDPFAHYIHILHDEALTKACCKMVFEGDEWNAYDQGLYSKQEIQTLLCTKYPDYEKEIKVILKDWVQLLETMPATLALMQKLKMQGYHLFIISNLSEESYLHIQNEPYFQYVDGAVLSYQEKLNKPDLRIYQTFLKRYELDAKECIFIDDRLANIEAANEVGIHGIVYGTHEQVVEAIEKIINEEKAC